jgi:hypothetical protein
LRKCFKNLVNFSHIPKFRILGCDNNQEITLRKSHRKILLVC